MKVKVTKLYKGLVELRDYDVKKCIDDNKSITVTYVDDSMELSPEELKNSVKSVSKLFASKMGGKSYKLMGYVWNPN